MAEEIKKVVNNETETNNETNVVKLSELVEMCLKHHNGEISLEELQDWSKVVNFRPFIPIREKMITISDIIFEKMYPENYFERLMVEHMYKFWYITMSYTNVELEEDLLTEQNYDLIYSYCSEWIKGQVTHDVENYEKLYDYVIKNVQYTDSIDTFKELTNTDFSKLIASNDKLIHDLIDNKEIIADLGKIMVGTNPLTSGLNNIQIEEAPEETTNDSVEETD